MVNCNQLLFLHPFDTLLSSAMMQLSDKRKVTQLFLTTLSRLKIQINSNYFRQLISVVNLSLLIKKNLWKLPTSTDFKITCAISESKAKLGSQTCSVNLNWQEPPWLDPSQSWKPHLEAVKVDRKRRPAYLSIKSRNLVNPSYQARPNFDLKRKLQFLETLMMPSLIRQWVCHPSRGKVLSSFLDKDNPLVRQLCPFHLSMVPWSRNLMTSKIRRYKFQVWSKCLRIDKFSFLTRNK